MCTGELVARMSHKPVPSHGLARAAGVVVGAAAAVAGFAALFSRDPERHPAVGEGLITSPADGRVTEIAALHGHPPVDGPAVRISIFLSLLDVHVIRSPVDGRVVQLERAAGGHRPAFLDRARHANERLLVGIEGEHGLVRMALVAGALARRIDCSLAPGEVIERAQRIGRIRLGSRTEIEVPAAEVEVLAHAGEHVRAGETVLARWRR